MRILCPNGKKSKSPEQGMITDWTPHVTVAAIIERDHQFLMVEELAGGLQVINQPAGHLEFNESLKEAVVRETLEETTWHFIPQAITGIYRWINPQNNETFLRICFCGECVNQEPEGELDDNILRTLWLSRDELTKQPKKLRSPLVLRCIDDYLSGQRHDLALLIDVESL